MTHDSTITLAPLRPSDCQNAIDLFSRVFQYDEPISIACGTTIESQREWFEMYVPRMCGGNSSLSVGAYRHSVSDSEHANSGKDQERKATVVWSEEVLQESPDFDLIGCFIAEDFATPSPAAEDQFLEQYKKMYWPLYGILGAAEDAFRDAYGIPRDQLPPPNKFVHLWCVGVDESARGLGLTTAMTKWVLKHAVDAGFEVSMAEATGFYSMKALQAAGMTALESYDYATFECDDEDPSEADKIVVAGHHQPISRSPSFPLTGIPLPHSAATLMVAEHTADTSRSKR